jgi:hypothetical protein
MKYFLLAICMDVILSCSAQVKSIDSVKASPQKNVIGSTLLNIENSSYVVLQFEIDKKPCLALINQSFKNYAHKSDFPYAVWITVETREKNENGHPLINESNLFKRIEDSVNSRFAGSIPFCYIGHTTRDGYREIMIFVSDLKKANQLMNEFVSQKIFDRDIKFDIAEDREWESVSGFYL